MNGRYILDDNGTPVAEPDLMKWGTWFEKGSNRIVAKDRFVINGEDVKVSTVFLGLDHAWGDTAPVLWESMIFGGPKNGEMERCSGNRDAANAMHQEMIMKAHAK